MKHHQTLEDDTVTIRHRDTTVQERVKISEVKGIIEKAVSLKRIFEEIV